jgi:hypothetical protein
MKTKLATLAILATTLIGSQAVAGAANTVLQCKDASGKLVLEGDVPGDMADFRVKATAKGVRGPVTVELFSEPNQNGSGSRENGQITVIEDLDQGVYTLRAEAIPNRYSTVVSLYAIPKTVKVKHKSNGVTSSFRAKLAVGQDNDWASANVSCTTDYSI